MKSCQDLAFKNLAAATSLLALIGATAASAQSSTPPNGAPGATAGQDPATETAAGQAVLSSEVIVTARRRSERLQDVPVAVTALSGAELASRRIDSTDALRFVAPALQVSPTAFGKAVPGYTIRSQRSLESLITQDPAVGIYFAEQVQQRPHGTNASLYDLGSVEVLKGPQGTLFGRNTTGGAILINPARPTRLFEGSIQLDGGSYDLRRATAVVNIPLSDTLAVRFAGRLTRRDGYVRNLTTGQRTDDERTDSGRVSLAWTPNDRFESYAVVNYFRENDQGGAFLLAQLNPAGAAAAIPGVRDAFLRQRARSIYEIENNQQPFADITAWSANDISTLRLGAVTVKNIVGYRKVKSYVGFDYDGSPVSLFESRNRLNTDQWTEELQLSGNLTDALNYIGGVYYFHEHGRDVQNSILFGTRANDGEGTNTSYSAYAQIGYKLAQRLNLTVGARYTIDKRELIARNLLNGNCRLTDANGVALNPCYKQFSTTFRSPSWLASLDYKLTDDTMVYLSHRRGYRSGGWNLRANKPAEQVPFRPENVYDIEAGIKTELLDRRVRINAAVYNQWYKDIQRTLSFGVPLATVVLNAGRATIRGGEVEVNVVPSRWLELSGSVAYSDAKYTKFTAPGLGDLTGNVFAMAPKLTYTGTARLNLPIPEAMGKASIAASYYHQSKIYIGDLNQGPYLDLPIAAYGLVDLNADWHGVAGFPIDIGLFVKNFTKKQYLTGGAAVYSSTGFDGETIGEPRRFGVSIAYRFGAAAAR